MLTLSRKTDYALVAVSALAAWSPAALSARELADRLGMPPAMLRNVLKDLAGAGVLSSVQGSHGGYMLARDASDILVGEVIRAIEGDPVLARCCTSEDAAPGEALCPIESGCRIKGAVRRLHLRVRDLIGSVTVRDLLDAEEHDVRALVGIGITRSGEHHVPPATAALHAASLKEATRP
jgi:Rrf2 family protein